MGMFDHVEVIGYPLPDGLHSDNWQTKSLDCLMDTYEIRADGTLWRRSGWLRDDDGIPKVTRLTWTGELDFYDWDPETGRWYELLAVFHDGRVHRIERLVDEEARRSR